MSQSMVMASSVDLPSRNPYCAVEALAPELMSVATEDLLPTVFLLMKEGILVCLIFGRSFHVSYHACNSLNT